jgi:hypothetical protein
MYKKKKAISGLIIAVLLVAVAIALGAMLISWIFGITQGNVETAKLEQYKLDYCKQVNYRHLLTTKHNDTAINMTFENTADATFSGMGAKVFYRNGIDVEIVDGLFEEVISKNQRGVSTFDLTLGNASDVVQVTLYPVVYVVDPYPQHLECDTFERQLPINID